MSIFTPLHVDKTYENNDFDCKQEFVRLLSTGGDDRSWINPETELNKYYQKPEPAHGILFRASCTCNIPTHEGFNNAYKTYLRILYGTQSVGEVMSEVRNRLKEVYNLEGLAEVVLTPSGTDAEYIPLLFAKTLHPKKRLINVVTVAGEVGSGTLDAAAGRYFSTCVSLSSEWNKKEGAKLHDTIEGFADNCEITAIPIDARHINGEVVDPNNDINRIMKSVKHIENSFIILHIVIGSKTGICQKMPELKTRTKPMLVVDACQGRFTLKELHDALAVNALILFTGSKFFRGVPFCGAVFIPKNIISELQSIAVEIPYGLNSFITKSEFPCTMPAWREKLSDCENVSLALRWITALGEIEKTVAISEQKRDEAISLWREKTIEIISNTPGIELFKLTETDKRCIISVTVRQYFNDPTCDSFMNTDDLSVIYKFMSTDCSGLLGKNQFLPPEATLICYVGQPVLVCAHIAVLRLALGSHELRDILERGVDAVSWQDAAIIKKIAFLASRINDLRNIQEQQNLLQKYF